ncbi:TPA: hypothetical protein ACIAJC_004054, partial [Citrobacter freundii]
LHDISSESHHTPVKSAQVEPKGCLGEIQKTFRSGDKKLSSVCRYSRRKQPFTQSMIDVLIKVI